MAPSSGINVTQLKSNVQNEAMGCEVECSESFSYTTALLLSCLAFQRQLKHKLFLGLSSACYKKMKIIFFKKKFNEV